MNIICPFCGADGIVMENKNARHEISPGKTSAFYGLWFPEHEGNCPLKLTSYRCDYLSANEAINAHKLKAGGEDMAVLAKWVGTLSSATCQIAPIIRRCAKALDGEQTLIVMDNLRQLDAIADEIRAEMAELRKREICKAQGEGKG